MFLLTGTLVLHLTVATAGCYSCRETLCVVSANSWVAAAQALLDRILVAVDACVVVEPTSRIEVDTLLDVMVAIKREAAELPLPPLPLSGKAMEVPTTNSAGAAGASHVMVVSRRCLHLPTHSWSC